MKIKNSESTPTIIKQNNTNKKVLNYTFSSQHLTKVNTKFKVFYENLNLKLISYQNFIKAKFDIKQYFQERYSESEFKKISIKIDKCTNLEELNGLTLSESKT